jgi:hypothetical protein
MTDLLPIGVLVLALLAVVVVFAVSVQRLRGHGRSDRRGDDGSSAGGGTTGDVDSRHDHDHGGFDGGGSDGGGGDGGGGD